MNRQLPDRQLLPIGNPSGAVNRPKVRPRVRRGRSAIAIIAALLAGGSLVTGCTVAGGSTDPPGADQVAAATHRAACQTTVQGVVSSPGSLTAGWLPAGFQLTGGDAPSPDDTPGATYAATGEGADPPRVQLHFSYSPGPLSPLDGGNATATPVEVQGHPALLESGPPAALFIGVYWKPTAGVLLSTVGYKVPSSVVVQVAQRVRMTPPGEVPLPLTAGPVVARSAAITAARRAVTIVRATVEAKLSSWTEVTTLLYAGNDGTMTPKAALPSVSAPWAPVWAVLLSSVRSTGAPNAARPGSTATEIQLVVIDAASGQAQLAVREGGDTSWFDALTDRDPGLGGCPGGSSARLPFGVLTRDEEAHVARSAAIPGAAEETTSVILKLTTVPTLNRADPGLYGGCLQQNCSLPELVWPSIVIVHAPGGRTVACLPPDASVPLGYQPRQVAQYVRISVTGSGEIACGPLPVWVDQLKDLAPPAAG